MGKDQLDSNRIEDEVRSSYQGTIWLLSLDLDPLASERTLLNIASREFSARVTTKYEPGNSTIFHFIIFPLMQIFYFTYTRENA